MNEDIDHNLKRKKIKKYRISNEKPPNKKRKLRAYQTDPKLIKIRRTIISLVIIVFSAAILIPAVLGLWSARKNYLADEQKKVIPISFSVDDASKVSKGFLSSRSKEEFLSYIANQNTDDTFLKLIHKKILNSQPVSIEKAEFIEEYHPSYYKIKTNLDSIVPDIYLVGRGNELLVDLEASAGINGLTLEEIKERGLGANIRLILSRRESKQKGVYEALDAYYLDNPFPFKVEYEKQSHLGLALNYHFSNKEKLKVLANLQNIKNGDVERLILHSVRSYDWVF